MAWNQQQQNSNGQPQYKIPDPGTGKLRPPKTRTDKSPHFRGLINVDGHIISAALWFYPAKPGKDGQMMPETFMVKAETFDPNRQQGAAPPQQQQMQYAPQTGQGYVPQGAPNQAAMPVYAQTPPQGGGYQPAPGYQPPQQAPQQPPRWGGAPGQQQPQGYVKSEVPF